MNLNNCTSVQWLVQAEQIICMQCDDITRSFLLPNNHAYMQCLQAKRKLIIPRISSCLTNHKYYINTNMKAPTENITRYAWILLRKHSISKLQSRYWIYFLIIHNNRGTDIIILIRYHSLLITEKYYKITDYSNICAKYLLIICYFKGIIKRVMPYLLRVRLIPRATRNKVLALPP